MPQKPTPAKKSRGRPPGATGKAKEEKIELRVSGKQKTTYTEAGGKDWLTGMLDTYEPDALKALLPEDPPKPD